MGHRQAKFCQGAPLYIHPPPPRGRVAPWEFESRARAQARIPSSSINGTAVTLPAMAHRLDLAALGVSLESAAETPRATR